jgi:hypothetical protein
VSTDGIKGVWRSERRARWFFAAHLQNALGTGAGYVALLVLAYDRIGSAWARPRSCSPTSSRRCCSARRSGA